MEHIRQARRKFLFSAISGFIATLFAGLPKPGSAQSNSNHDKGFAVHETEGIHILTDRRKVPMNIKISKRKDGMNNISFCTEDIFLSCVCKSCCLSLIHSGLTY